MEQGPAWTPPRGRGGRVRPARHRPARTALAVGLAGAATLAASAALVLTSGHWLPGARPGAAGPGSQARVGALSPPAAPSRRGAASSSPAPGVHVAKSTLLATVRAAAPRYAGPGRLTAGTVPARWYQRPSVLPVVAAKPGWVQVRLAQRPNQSTAWLPAGDVTLSTTHYQIVVNLASTRLSLYDDGRLVLSAPAGVGTPDDPTPAGEFFVAFVEPPPPANDGYGPFILVTSAHSAAISDWEGSGDAVVGIHGPLGEDRQIGTTGARISHGCIRLHEAALEKLAAVPPGTPVEVVG